MEEQSLAVMAECVTAAVLAPEARAVASVTGTNRGSRLVQYRKRWGRGPGLVWGCIGVTGVPWCGFGSR